MNWADIVHICDHSNAIYTKYLNLPHLVTCHDLLAITSALGNSKESTKWTGKQLQRLILTGTKASTADSLCFKTNRDRVAKCGGD